MQRTAHKNMGTSVIGLGAMGSGIAARLALKGFCPVERTYPGEHVGSVFLNGRERSEDVEILLQTPQPLECRH